MAHDTVSTTGSRDNNPSGQSAHPKKTAIVKNDLTTGAAPQCGSDSFHARSPKASVKVT